MKEEFKELIEILDEKKKTLKREDYEKIIELLEKEEPKLSCELLKLRKKITELKQAGSDEAKTLEVIEGIVCSLVKELFRPKLKKRAKKADKIYTHSELENVSRQILKPGKLEKVGVENEIQIWRKKNVEYLMRLEDFIKLGGRDPKLYVSQLKNLSLLIALTQEQQFLNEKEAICEFTLAEYAKRRGYTKEEIERGGKAFEELKLDLLSGAYTTYRIDKIKINGKEYTRHGIPNFYMLDEPKDKGGTWIVQFNEPWRSWILDILEGKAKSYLIKNPKAIEDRYTTKNPHLFLFYLQLVKRRRNGLTVPIKIKNLLKDMKIPDKILSRPKECFELLKECIVYFCNNYKPNPEIVFFSLYRDFRRSDKIKLPLNTGIKFGEITGEMLEKYSYEDFLTFSRIKDIREVYICFALNPIKSEEEIEIQWLINKTLNWLNDPDNPNRLTKIPIEDQKKVLRKYIKKMGIGRYRELFNFETNKPYANPIIFFTETLKNWDKKSYLVDYKSSRKKYEDYWHKEYKKG